MDITIHPRLLAGSIRAIPSKSQAHRFLILAAFSDGPSEIICSQRNADLEATAASLRALGADVRYQDGRYRVVPVRELPARAELPCGESGSTLRFLLPVAGALGVDATFHLEGRLPDRPLSPLWEEMERMGCTLSRPTEHSLRCQGALRPGAYAIRADVSSQFVSGLLIGLSLLKEESRLTLTGPVESAPYIRLTLAAMKRFGSVCPFEDGCFSIFPAVFHSTGHLHVEGDWSCGAFWLAARILGSNLSVTGLDKASAQGDREVVRHLVGLEEFRVIDCADIPDLLPVLAVTAGALRGARFEHAGRLRLKESDRLESTAALIRALGGNAEVTADTLTVEGTGFHGGTVDSCGDHRIAMAAAIAATVCQEPVVIRGAEAVEKSYPGFWSDYHRLGGILR